MHYGWRLCHFEIPGIFLVLPTFEVGLKNYPISGILHCVYVFWLVMFVDDRLAAGMGL